MKIIIDTREQNPLVFKDPIITEVICETLPVGDYGCEFKGGQRPLIAFERKTISDLFSTLGKNHNRFRRELEKAHQVGISLFLIVEGSISEVLKGSPYSSVKGIAILRKILTLLHKYNLTPFFCENRHQASLIITEYFKAVGRQLTKKV